MHRFIYFSTWSPRFTSHDLYLRCRSLASRAKRSFDFGPPKTNGSNSKLFLLWLHNLEKMEKNYEDINTTVSFWILRCFRSTGYLLLITAHEGMYLFIYYLLTQKKAAHKTKHMSRPVFSCCIHIPSHPVQFCHSCHRVAWGKFVHLLGWGNFGHPNTLWTALTTHQPLQLNFSKL